MILYVPTWGSDNSMNAQADLDFAVGICPKDTFMHGVDHLFVTVCFYCNFYVQVMR